MNGRERLLNAMKHQPVDRIPVAPFTYFNAIYEMFGYKPAIADYFNPPDFDPIEKFVEYCDFFGFGVLHLLGSVWDFWTGRTFFDQGCTRSDENWDVKIDDQYKGDEQLLRTLTIQTPGGILRHIVNYQRTSKYLLVSSAQENLIKTISDFELFRRYAPPAERMNTSLITRARKATGDKGLVDTIMHGSFNILGIFRNLEEVLVDSILDPVLYNEMVNYFLPRLIARAKKMIEAGADIIELGGHWTGQVGPEIFKQHILENETKLVRAIHEMGGFVIYHNCGNAASAMPYYNEMEIDCLGYLTPPPYADVILDDALKILRPDLTLRGNIDQIEFLQVAKPQQVHEKVRQLIEKVKERGNWILSTTDFCFDGTPYENLHAMAEACHKFGNY